MDTTLEQKLKAVGKAPSGAEKRGKQSPIGPVGAIRGAKMRAKHGKLINVEAAGETFLPAPRVCERYNITDMSLWRWLRNPDIGFPKPLYIGRFRYWRLSDLVAFEQRDTA